MAQPLVKPHGVVPAQRTGARTAELNRMLLAICLGAFVSHLTAGIVNIALPGLSATFQQDISLMQWIASGYLLVIAALLPMMGKWGDRFGSKRIHNIGYIIFGFSSLLTLFTETVYGLLVLRVIQAFGAAMFQATNIGLVSRYFPTESRGRALGFVSTAVALGALSGPMIGGLIMDWLNWHWLFLIHVPVLVIATFLAFRYIPTDSSGVVHTPDWVGGILFAVCIITFIFCISNGNAWGWTSRGILFTFALSLLAFVGLYYWVGRRVRRKREPFLNVSLFAKPAVSAGMFVGLATFVAVFATQVTLPFYLLGVRHFAPSQAGIMIMMYPVALGIMGPISGSLSDKHGSSKITMIGLISMSGALILLSFISKQTPVSLLGLSLLVLGAGMGMVTSPNYSLIMGSVDKSSLGAVGGMVALVRNLGLVLGTAMGISFLDYAFPGSISRWMVTKEAAYAPYVVSGLRTVFMMSLIFCLLGILFLGLALRRRLLQAP
ncbi:MFS transporter [Aneurinibacillus migulanus]|uniref:Drug resistance transporter, EmrB/QacA subfamily n=2 Tax=Aneurinibacillus migulanus TaxID=47500 RepID=A0A1G8HI51_ANEMI|nr:MFS transporter [Aneurinibacillus migulanus]MED0891434.1 MFS transporter [Aneurinibacillus migulanus]MED1613877.1 MFS transporter [Aneurinibacillus migulanus]GED12124.1 MFS transporter [Aneurinibacillus migulanus]SDI06171.1 drug resistance transporter, EmrB/QacA subfamily [Aneurinibacillus migulanus]